MRRKSQRDAAAGAKSRPSSGRREEEEGKEEEKEEEEPYPPPLTVSMAKLGPGQGLVCEAAEGSLTPSRKREYTEGKRPLYAICFNFLDARYHNVFATVGRNRVTPYGCMPNGSFSLLQPYFDEDKDESFYALSWACDLDGTLSLRS